MPTGQDFSQAYSAMITGCSLDLYREPTLLPHIAISTTLTPLLSGSEAGLAGNPPDLDYLDFRKVLAGSVMECLET